MKLGKDFFFWARIIIAVLRAIVRIVKGPQNGDQVPGEIITEAVLDVVIAANEDDKLASVKDLMSRVDPKADGSVFSAVEQIGKVIAEGAKTGPERKDNLAKIDKILKTEGRKTA